MESLSQYTGKWVAITAKGIIKASVSVSFDAAFDAAKKHGEETPFVFKIPAKR